ncbi:MAG: DUF2007 domain-containing protein [Mangrovibacterium sp.]|jgi:hypothetical protein
MEKDFVKVYSSSDPYQADIAHDVLDENGIQSVVMDQHDTMFPSVGEIDIYVHQDDEAAALELLKSMTS